MQSSICIRNVYFTILNNPRADKVACQKLLYLRKILAPYRLNMPKLEFTPEHIRRMLRPIDFNDMKYAIDGMDFTFATSLYDTTWFDKVQLADDNFYREYDEVRPLFSAAASDMLTDEERARLEHLTHPFFREACLTAEAEIRAAAAAAEGKIRIETTPDVDDDSLLDAIVGQYAALHDAAKA